MTSPSFVEMRRRNAQMILDVVRRKPGVSRADLSREVDLARATVSSIVDELIGLKILEESGSKSSLRGRKPIGLNFKPNSKTSIGISIEDNRAQITLCDLNGRQLASQQVVYKDIDLDGQAAVIKLLEQILRTHSDFRRIYAITLALPGPLQVKGSDRQNKTAPDRYAPLVTLLEGHFGRKLALATNIEMAALAETHAEQAECEDELLAFVRIGHNLRVTFLQNNAFLNQFSQMGGNLGELIFPMQNSTLARLWEPSDMIGVSINELAGEPMLLSSARKAGLAVETLDELVILASKKDPIANDLLDLAADGVAYGLASLINIIGSSRLILAGYLPDNHGSFLPRADLTTRQLLKKTNNNAALIQPIIQKSIMDRGAESYGAALFGLSLENILPPLKGSQRKDREARTSKTS